MWRFFLELFAYSCFVSVLYIISYSNHDATAYLQVQHLSQLFLNPQNMTYAFSEVGFD